MYKLLMGLLFGLLAITQAQAQSIPRSLRATAGGTLTGGGSQLTFTIGETVIPTLATGGNMLTQGFQQPGEQLKAGVLGATTLCPGAGLNLPYSAIDIGGGNTFTAQLSDASGSFANPVNIGSASGNASGTIAATIPANTPAGTGYLIRVISSSPALAAAFNNGHSGLALPGDPAPTPVTIAANAYYADTDGDSYGAGSALYACTAPPGYVPNQLDCNDANAAISPGATEICNGKDDNCNGLVDDGLIVACTAPTVTAPTVTQPTCIAPLGRIIVRATGTQTMQYSIDSGATYKSTASFANLAPGSYHIMVRYVSNPAYAVPYASNPVIINPVPPLAAPSQIIGPEGVCRNATGIIFSVPKVPGATSYVWTLGFGMTGSSTTDSITLSFSATYVTKTLCVKAVNACGESTVFCREVKYYGARPVTPDAIVGKEIGLCSNQTYSVTPVPNTTSYIWTPPANTNILSGQGTTQIVLQFVSGFVSGNLTVAASNCKGTSPVRSLALARNPATPASISGPLTEVCGGSTQNYSCPPVTGATTYAWTVPTGAVINSGQGTTAISVTFPAGYASGTVKVSSGTSCSGGSAARSVTVTSSPPQPAPIVGPVSVCPSATGLVYSTTAVAGVTYSWLVPNGATIVSGQGTASITVNWGVAGGQVRVLGTNSCGSSVYRNLTVNLLTCTPTITMAKAEQVNAEPAENSLAVKLWPNPARDVLMVTLDEFVPNQKVELTLMQADGKVQQAQSLVPTIKGQQVRMDVSRAAAGYYILAVNQSGKMVNRQVVIMR